MTSKTELLNDLFDRWEKAIPEYQGKFVKDGIVDEPQYVSAPTKILIIAKEPNNPKQDAGDFREWWRKEIAYTFSYRIPRCAGCSRCHSCEGFAIPCF